jgi:hypothetical protein
LTGRCDRFSGRAGKLTTSTTGDCACAPDAASSNNEKRKEGVFMVFVFGYVNVAARVSPPDVSQA